MAKSRAPRASAIPATVVPDPKGPDPSSQPHANLWIYLFLFAVTLLVYSQVRQFEFIMLDDSQDVREIVQRGITVDGVLWALQSGEDNYWMPLSRMSHMLDCQLFGMDAGWHHVSNAVIHALAVLALFAFLMRATGARWRSAFVAFVFALHPLHVESVAWVAERKDVLSGLFWFLTLWAYVRYVERPGPGPYVLTLGLFCLDLMSKPMVVTLPLVLILLDIWPLQRFRALDAVGSGSQRSKTSTSWQAALREKVPFFALSAIGSVIAYTFTQQAGAVQALPLDVRITNAITSYGVYLAKALWPIRLAVIYPYEMNLPAWEPLLSGLAIVLISILVLRKFRTSPYLSIGWFWYLVTLVPAIGFVQVGGQARADRFMYIPLVGLTMMVAWGAVDLLQRWPSAETSLRVVAAAVCVSLLVATWVQLPYWKGSEPLFEHAIEVTGPNYLAQYDLAGSVKGDQSLTHLRESVAIEPNWGLGHYQLGLQLLDSAGQLPEAIKQLQWAERLSNDYHVQYQLGVAFSRIPSQLPTAILHLETALRMNPTFVEGHTMLGLCLLAIPQRVADAIGQLETAVKLAPDDAVAHNDLGLALARVPARVPEAITQFQAAIRIKPDYAEAHYNLGAMLASTPGRAQESIDQLEAALKVNPKLEDARQLLTQVQASRK